MEFLILVMVNRSLKIGIILCSFFKLFEMIPVVQSFRNIVIHFYRNVLKVETHMTRTSFDVFQ